MSFKLQGAGKRERSVIPMKSYDLVRDIVGRANEVPLIVCGKEVSALLDTVSMVSTTETSLCSSIDLTVQPLDNVLSIEGASGLKVPYLIARNGNTVT